MPSVPHDLLYFKGLLRFVYHKTLLFVVDFLCRFDYTVDSKLQLPWLVLSYPNYK